jgi:hypothetical protein
MNKKHYIILSLIFTLIVTGLIVILNWNNNENKKVLNIDVNLLLKEEVIQKEQPINKNNEEEIKKNEKLVTKNGITYDSNMYKEPPIKGKEPKWNFSQVNIQHKTYQEIKNGKN